MKIHKLLVSIVSVLCILFSIGCVKKVDKKDGVESRSSQGVLELIGQLDSNNPDQVVSALEQIQVLGPKAELAIPALLRKLGDRNILIKIETKKALVAIGSKAAKALIESDESATTAQYLMVLKDFGPAVVVPMMMEQLSKTRNPEKFMYLLISLGDMGQSANQALPQIRSMMDKFTDSAEILGLLKVVEAQLEGGMAGLDKLIEKNEKDLVRVETSMNNKLQEFRDRINNATTFDFTLDPPGLETLMDMWNNDLATAIPLIDVMMESKDVKDKEMVLSALLKFGSMNKKNIPLIMPRVKQLCSDEAVSINLVASVIANKFGDSTDYSDRYIKALVAMDDRSDVLIAIGGLLISKTKVTDDNAILVLETILDMRGAPAATTGAALVLLNSGRTENVQKYAESLITEPNKEARINGVAMIVKMGPAAKSSISKLRFAYEQETNENMKAFIGNAISSLGEIEDDLQGLLMKIKNPQRFIRCNAFDSMEKLSSASKRESIPHLVELIVNGDQDTKELALITLCKYKTDAEPASGFLMKLMESSLAQKNNFAQFQIASVMGDIGKAEFAPLLFEVLRDGNADASLSAKVSLHKLGPNAKGIVSDLLTLAKDPMFQSDVLSIINDIGVLETSEQVGLVTEFLSSDVGLSSFNALRILILQGNDVCIPILKKAALSTNRRVCRSGIFGLYEIGLKSPTIAIQTLEELKLEINDQDVQKGIDNTIQEIKNPKKR